MKTYSDVGGEERICRHPQHEEGLDTTYTRGRIKRGHVDAASKEPLSRQALRICQVLTSFKKFCGTPVFLIRDS